MEEALVFEEAVAKLAEKLIDLVPEKQGDRNSLISLEEITCPDIRQVKTRYQILLRVDLITDTEATADIKDPEAIEAFNHQKKMKVAKAFAEYLIVAASDPKKASPK